LRDKSIQGRGIVVDAAEQNGLVEDAECLASTNFAQRLCNSFVNFMGVVVHAPP
jgi:hypothetical protein